MSFDVAGDAYGRFMGRFSEPLAERFLALAGLRDEDPVLDVGCGPAALLPAGPFEVVAAAWWVRGQPPSSAVRGRM